MNHDKKDDDHFGYKGFCDLTGLKPGTAYSLVSRKEVPHVRLGRRIILFNRREILDWIRAHRIVCVREKSANKT